MVVALGVAMAFGTPALADTTVTFRYTGNFQSLTLPRGVPSVTLRVEGARGGDGAVGGGTGGMGATATATISLPAGQAQTLEIYVGGAGGNGCEAVAGQVQAPSCSAGNYHDGGIGAMGNPASGDDPPVGGGGGGGSSSSVYLGSFGLATAGGGGGGGGGRGASGSGGNGGQSSGGATGPLGGGGGTETAGGAGGGTGGSQGDAFPGSDPEAPYIDADGGQGQNFGGGGGGGGYHGGGGGAFDQVHSNVGSGGGGGGSNYVDPTATDVSVFDGTVLGAGSVTVTYPPPTSTSSAPPPDEDEKDFAALDFLEIFPLAAVECDGPQLLADAFEELGYGFLTPLIADACNDDEGRLDDDLAIFLDPPDARIGVVAEPVKVSAHVRLPTCRAPADAAMSCRRLRAAVVSYIVSARQIKSIDDALHTTFDRLSSARKAGNAADIALQQRAVVDLSGRLHRAITARAKRTRTVLARLSPASRRAGLTRAQDADAIARLLRRLERAGVPSARLRTIAGKALTPRPIKLSALL